MQTSLVNQTIPDSNIFIEFPKISTSAGNKFPKEITLLKLLWNECIKMLNENNDSEIQFKNGLLYKFSEHPTALQVTGTSTASVGLSCIGIGIHLGMNTCVPIALVITGIFSGMVGTIVTGASCLFQGNLTEKYNIKKNIYTEYLDKISNCVKLIVSVGELVAISESIKKDLSSTKLPELFDAFVEVQKNELIYTRKETDMIERLLLMDNFCDIVESKEKSTDPLVKGWREFTTVKTELWESQILQPIALPAIRASKGEYQKFLIQKKYNTESQIDKKVFAIREYVKREFQHQFLHA